MIAALVVGMVTVASAPSCEASITDEEPTRYVVVISASAAGVGVQDGFDDQVGLQDYAVEYETLEEGESWDTETDIRSWAYIGASANQLDVVICDQSEESAVERQTFDYAGQPVQPASVDVANFVEMTFRDLPTWTPPPANAPRPVEQPLPVEQPPPPPSETPLVDEPPPVPRSSKYVALGVAASYDLRVSAPSLVLHGPNAEFTLGGALRRNHLGLVLGGGAFVPTTVDGELDSRIAFSGGNARIGLELLTPSESRWSFKARAIGQLALLRHDLLVVPPETSFDPESPILTMPTAQLAAGVQYRYAPEPRRSELVVSLVASVDVSGGQEYYLGDKNADHVTLLTMWYAQPGISLSIGWQYAKERR